MEENNYWNPSIPIGYLMLRRIMTIRTYPTPMPFPRKSVSQVIDQFFQHLKSWSLQVTQKYTSLSSYSSSIYRPTFSSISFFIYKLHILSTFLSFCTNVIKQYFHPIIYAMKPLHQGRQIIFYVRASKYFIYNPLSN